MEAYLYVLMTLLVLIITYIMVCLTMKSYFRYKTEFTIGLMTKVKELKSNG